MEGREVRRRLTPAPKWAAAVLAIAVMVLVALAALGARGLPGSETRPPPFPVDVDLLVVFRIMMGIVAGLMALLMILLVARARAILQGRDFVTPDDVKSVAIPALAHRLILRPELWVQDIQGDDIVAECLDLVPTPLSVPESGSA